jgi:N utilization substance protein B
MASRHLSRSIALQTLFEWDFYGKKEGTIGAIIERNIEEFGPDLENKTFARQLVEGILNKIEELDRIIIQAAPEWPIEQITLVDRNALRIGLYELLYAKREEVPPKVAINEAIELAKNFGGESSGKFINGVLGTVYKEIQGVEQEEAKEKDLPVESLSGGIIYRKKDGNYQIALLLDAFGRWTLPKGHVEKEETLEQAARREIKEELGLENLKIIKGLGEREYLAREPKKGLIKKKVADFLFESGENNELNVEKSGGIKEAKWFNLEEIADLKQYKETKTALEEIGRAHV